MRRSVKVFFGVALVLSLSNPALAGEPRRYLISGKNSDSAKEKIIRENGSIHHGLRYHKGFVALLTEEAADRLRNESGAVVEEDVEVQVAGKISKTTPPPPAQEIPWGISAVKARDANAINRGLGVTVCVLDTGIQPNHPDLSTNIAGGENFVMGRKRVDPSAWADDNGHGTHVAGTIAALDNGIGVVGVAPNAKLFAVKALDANGTGYLSDVAEGIRSCVSHGAKVINMSLGASAGISVLEDAIQFAKNAGVIMVAAAGNDASSVSYPAKYPQVIAVSAVDSSMRIAYFSNTGPEIAFAAPGVSVYSTMKDSSYATYSGTSMAAPHVAGVAALMISSRSTGILADDIFLPAEQQGAGFVNALRTVQH